jgi:hypothetical protein
MEDRAYHVPSHKLGTSCHDPQCELLLSRVLIRLESLQHIAQNLVVHFSTLAFAVTYLILYNVVDVSWKPAFVLEAYSGTWMGADSEKKMMRKVCRTLIIFASLRCVSIIQFGYLV